jgi:hypothetical protein
MDFINVNCDNDCPILNIRALNGALRGILKEEISKQNSPKRKQRQVDPSNNLLHALHALYSAQTRSRYVLIAKRNNKTDGKSVDVIIS